MNSPFSVRRSLALTAALALTTLGGVALPAQAMDHDNGSGNGNGQSKHGDVRDKDKGDRGDKGDKGDTGNGPKNKGDKGDGGGGTGDPAGNNGTVKIAPVGELDGIPNNSPHPGCEFDIEWYGFDEGADIISTVVFEMQAPTSDVGLSGTDPSEVFVGGDPATGAGTETGFDGEQTYHLVFDGEAHAQQGYHVKLTIHTPGSQGADTKHKVFWVEPCEDAVTGGTDTEEDTTTDETGEDTEDTEVAGVQASTGTSSQTESDDTEVMGAQASAPAAAAANAADQDVPSAVDAGEESSSLAAFVTSPLPLLVIGLGVALGAAALVSRRRAAGTN